MRHRVRLGRAGVSAAVFCAIVLLGIVPVQAGPDEGVGTSPAAFLEIPIGATTTVVPEIVAGMSPDGAILFANPSSLGDLRRRELYFTTSNWLGEFNLSAASASLPVRSLGLTWSLGARLLYAGDLQGYDATGVIVSQENYYDMALTSGVGKRFDGIGLALGLGVTYLREHLAVQDGDGVTYTAGVSYEIGSSRFDFIARDMGGKLSFEDRSYDIDAQYVAGYGYRMRRQWGAVSLGTQAMFSRGEFQRLGVGVAYDPNQYLTVRSGFGHSVATTSQSDVPVTAGMSVHLGDVNLDYAFTPRQYFSDTHTFSIAFAFGGGPGHGGDMTPTRYDAAPMFSSSPAAPEVAPGGNMSAGKRDATYLIVAGTHARLESAEAEARSLRLLKIPAVAEESGGRYWVVVDRFDSREEAVSVLRTMRNRGHRFAIVVNERK